MLERGGRALLAEARDALAALRDRRLALALGLFAALLLLAAQAPLVYHIEVGQEDGPGGDLPLVRGFYPPESDVHGDFRWTTERAQIRLPGVGSRPLQVALHVFPISPEVAQRGPREIELWDDGRLLARLPVRPAGAIYRFVAPPEGSGDQLIELRSSTYTPAGDQRAIGAPVDAVSAVAPPGPALPAWRSSLIWLLAALPLWLALRRAGFGPIGAQRLLLAGALLAGLAALLDPPRFAFGAAPALTAFALGWLLALGLCAARPALLAAGSALALAAAAARVAGLNIDLAAALAGLGLALALAGSLRPAIGALYRRIAPPIAPGAWRWLLLIALMVLATRYGGKIYPDSMPGDIGFHDNRYADVLRGAALLLSRNRGVDFPYPPAYYMLLAPLSLLGLGRRVQLQLVGALLDALSPLLIYAIAARSAAPREARRATLAAAIYSFTAAGFLTTWWNFSTHIFTQFAHLLLIAALVLLWRAADARPPAPLAVRWALAGLFLLQGLVYLGHFGFWINMSLLGALALLALLVAALRGRAPMRIFRAALAGFVAAQLFAALFFYSGYAGLFLDQARRTASGGLTGLAGRAAVDPAVLWATLWDAGFRVHFGFFPLPLALCGLLLVGAARGERSATPAWRRLTAPVVALMAGTFLIALGFAALPFISGSTLSTRWLLFSAWAVAVGAAASAQLLWRYGRAGRLLVLAMSCYTVWVTASVWIAALAWRVRPPEPF